MCGINGIAWSSRAGRVVDEAALARMRDVQFHRGPDDAGLHIDRNVGLGHRRLSIVDLASGHQPLANEDGTVHIVFNGEIYNHAEHRVPLEARGHRFATHSDTEAIVHLYEEYGAACVKHLRGMFAFAIWDRNRRELLVARDRLGVKPLYYVHTSDGSLLFASEVKALLETDVLKAELNVAALPDYLANHATSDDDTLFAGVKRLRPGHLMVWRDGSLDVRRYWDVCADDAAIDAGRTDAEYVEGWRDLFRTAVRIRLMADVPLGMFLSGGIDSSAIAAMMSGMVDEPIKTFSVAFDSPEANELEYARVVASAFRTDHHEVIVGPDDFLAALPHLIWHEDEPLAHPSSVALHFVSQLARRHVKVVLTGEGSDETLGGYNRYRATLANMRLGEIYAKATSESVRRGVRRFAFAAAPASIARRLPRTFLCRPPDIEAMYFDNFAVFSRQSLGELLAPELHERLAGIDSYAGMRRSFEAPETESLLRRFLYADVKTYLHELLMKQDQMSMAASIESRVPFLDHKLVEYSFAMPDRMKLRGWTTKVVLRKAMKGVLPATILERKKLGFPVPAGRWFRGCFSRVLDEYVLSGRATSRGLFHPSCPRRLVEEHRAGRVDHAERLWALVTLEMWMRIFLDGEAPSGRIPDVAELR